MHTWAPPLPGYPRWFRHFTKNLHTFVKSGTVSESVQLFPKIVAFGLLDEEGALRAMPHFAVEFKKQMELCPAAFPTKNMIDLVVQLGRHLPPESPGG